MRQLILVAISVCAMAGSSVAQVYEPMRGSAERAALLDAVRPHAEWRLGAPVEFVVDTMRVSGAVGYAALQPQRPGGAPIDLADTPIGRDNGVGMFDGAGMQVLYVKSGETWVALHWAIGATDVWWAAPDLCAAFGVVTPEACLP